VSFEQMKAMCVWPVLLLLLLLLGPWPAGAYRTPFDQRPEEARGRPEDRSRRDGPSDSRYVVVLTRFAWSDVYTSNSMTGGFKQKTAYGPKHLVDIFKHYFKSG